MSDLKYLTDENIAQAAEMVEIIHPLVLGENLRTDLLLICEELAALRARHEKLREFLRTADCHNGEYEGHQRDNSLCGWCNRRNALLEDE